MSLKSRIEQLEKAAKARDLSQRESTYVEFIHYARHERGLIEPGQCSFKAGVPCDRLHELNHEARYERTRQRRKERGLAD
jgi:hypothetical protein